MRQPKKLAEPELFAYGVRKLAGRACSTGELRNALSLRAAQPSDVDGIISRLKDLGYLNDARFAESFATARLENEGLGKSRVLRDLRQHRVAPDLADKTISKVYADKDEAPLIEQYIRRKFRLADREKLFNDEKDLASAYRRLMRAGFTSGGSLRVLKRFALNPDLLDSIDAEPPEMEE